MVTCSSLIASAENAADSLTKPLLPITFNRLGMISLYLWQITISGISDLAFQGQMGSPLDLPILNIWILPVLDISLDLIITGTNTHEISPYSCKKTQLLPGDLIASNILFSLVLSRALLLLPFYSQLKRPCSFPKTKRQPAILKFGV